MHKDKTASIWKGIRSLVKLKSSSKKDISIIDDKGVIIPDQEKICNQFNNFFVNIGLNIDKTIPNSKRNFREYLHQIKVNKSFFLIPTIPEESFDIIISLDMNKSLGPNSVPIYILKVYNSFFSEKLSKIINLSFATGIFPDLCKIAKVVLLFKKENELLCENYRPISLLPIFRLCTHACIPS